MSNAHQETLTTASIAHAAGPTTDARQAAIAGIAEICKQELRPQVKSIDRDGIYPESVMRNLGSAGLYSQHVTAQGLTNEVDMAFAIEGMALVSYECLSTAFCVWCHHACGWYLEKTQNETLREKLVADIASGKKLGATGLSNPMKFYSEIEPLKLKGERVDGGYVVNGVLPWVSNLGDDHYFGLVFEEATNPSHRAMAMACCDQPGLELCDGGRFIALEGSRTYATRFKNCFIADEMILASPSDDYIKAIRPGFVLMQVGMAIGLVRACIDQMRKQDRSLSHVNCFLPDGADDLEEANEELLARTIALAATPHETDRDFVIAVLQARLDAAHLSLRASQAGMLNGGSRAYMETSRQFRKLREAYFVGVVTPATKHLSKEIARLKAM